MKKYIPLAQARQQFSQIVHEVRNEGTIYVITVHHRSAAVLMRTKAERELAVYKAERKLRKLYKQLLELLKEYA